MRTIHQCFNFFGLLWQISTQTNTTIFYNDIIILNALREARASQKAQHAIAQTKIAHDMSKQQQQRVPYSLRCAHGKALRHSLFTQAVRDIVCVALRMHQ